MGRYTSAPQAFRDGNFSLSPHPPPPTRHARCILLGNAHIQKNIYLKQKVTKS